MNKYDIKDNTSYSLGMSLTIEALKHKASFVKQIILSEKAHKNEQLDYLLSINDDTETRIFDYLDEFGRKSSR